MFTKTVRIVTFTAAACVVLGLELTRRSFNQQLYTRFPTIEQKILRRAYGRMLRKALSVEYPSLKRVSEDQFDLLLLREVDAISF